MRRRGERSEESLAKSSKEQAEGFDPRPGGKTVGCRESETWAELFG